LNPVWVKSNTEDSTCCFSG